MWVKDTVWMRWHRGASFVSWDIAGEATEKTAEEMVWGFEEQVEKKLEPSSLRPSCSLDSQRSSIHRSLRPSVYLDTNLSSPLSSCTRGESCALGQLHGWYFPGQMVWNGQGGKRVKGFDETAPVRAWHSYHVPTCLHTLVTVESNPPG